MTPNAVFVSYSHRDVHWKDKILVHFKSLTEKVSITVWDDTRIPLGSEWAANLRAELTRADVAILLLSADFLASDFIRDVEVPMLLAREAERKVRLLPIVLRPCAWQTVPWLTNRAVYPTNEKSLSSLTSAEAESQLTAIVGEILRSPVSEPVPVAASDSGHLDRREPGELWADGERCYYQDGWAGRTRESAEQVARAAADRTLQASRDRDFGTSISLVIEGPDASRFDLSRVPVSTTARQLVREFVRSLPISSLIRDNWTAVAGRKTSDGSNQRLNPDETLHDQNVQDGDTIQIFPEAKAGCFPVDTRVSTPDGRTVLLGTLQVGDQVASPRPHAEEDSVALVEEVVREHAARLIVINDMVQITPDHSVFCVSRGGEWVSASRLRLGDFLLRGDRRVVAVRTLALKDSDIEVANLVLQHPADVFVANGVVVFGARRTDLGALMKSGLR